jgi:hypothetical protein
MIDNDQWIIISNNYDFSELLEFSEFCPAVCYGLCGKLWNTVTCAQDTPVYSNTGAHAPTLKKANIEVN